MERTAVFVDAGYLFAQGSVALSGSKKPRPQVVLDAPKAISELKSLVSQVASETRLLRIYWYDGSMGGGRPTADHLLIASLNDVKLRLGVINSYGQQKGVDSLIVTDLIELARLKSISDAVLLSGDEDVRIGVQIAQSYGVRVHLIGIAPARASQSLQLLQEADTSTEWSAETIRGFLTLRADTEAPVVERSYSAPPPALAAQDEPEDQDVSSTVESVVSMFVAELLDSEIDTVFEYWKSSRGVPREFDGRMLATCRDGIGRELDKLEIKLMRTKFQALVKERRP